MKTKWLPLSFATCYELLALTLLVIIGSSCGVGETNQGCGCGVTPQPSLGLGVAIKVPFQGQRVATLPQISGIWNASEVINSPTIKLTLTRTSDGQSWSGTSWVASSPSVLTQFSGQITSPGQWATLPGTLPSGTNLKEDVYVVVATLTDISNVSHGASMSAFQVGNPPPPLNTKTFGWGFNGNGEVGAGPGPSLNLPTPVKTTGQLDGMIIVALAAGAEHTVALSHEGRVYAWGYNGFGELGRGVGNLTSSDEPVEVGGDNAVSSDSPLFGKQVRYIAAGDYHSFAIGADDELYAWGRNTNGELGNGVTGGNFPNPVRLNLTGGELDGKTIIGMTGGDHHTVAVTSEGRLYAWGANDNGQLGTGNNTPSNVPVAVANPGGKQFVYVEAGVFHTLALTKDGEVWAFGAGTEGLLGNGSTASSNVPVQVGTTGAMAGKRIVQISATRHHSLALSSNGTVFAWGSNAQLGLGDGGAASFVTTPVEVGGALAGKTIYLIGTGWLSSYAVTQDRKFFAWGNNFDGNLAGAGAAGFGAAVATPLEINTASILSAADTIATIAGGWRHAAMLTVSYPKRGPDIFVEATTAVVPSVVPPGGQINFGTDAPGGKRVAKLSVRNRGVLALTNLSTGLTGDDYTVDALPRTTLDPNEVMEFNIAFTPTAIGVRTGTFYIVSNDPDHQYFVINLTGTGVPFGDVGANVGALSLAGAVNATPVQTDGKIIFAGSFTSVGGTLRNNIARLNADGTLDTGFDPNVTGGIINCAAIQRDGKILIGGTFSSVGGQTRNRIARLLSTGALDTTFNPGADASVNAIHVNADGTILVGGSFTNLTAASPDFLAKLTATGSVDGTFNPVLSSLVRCITVQSDGMILIGGNFSTVSGQPRTRLARIDPNGIIDTSFTANVGGGNVFGVQALPDDKILAAGEFNDINGSTRNRIARMSSGGVVDGFNPNVAGSIFSMALQSDGSVIIGGTISTVAGTPRSNVARIKSDGTLDADFNPPVSGGTPVVNGVTLQPDGKILLAGNFNSVNGITRNSLVQISNITGTQTVTTGLNAVDEVIWSITGSVPQTIEPMLEKSTNGGASWTTIGQGVRLTAPATGWQWLITGSLPTGSALLRLRASAPGGLNGGSSSVIEQVINFNGPPVMAVSSIETGPLGDFSSYNFGPLGTGKAKVFVLHVTNTGGTPLTGLVGTNFFGDNAIEFGLASSSFANTIAPGDSTDITLVYQPRNLGSHTATLQIPNNDPLHAAQGFQLFLSGIGGQPIGNWRTQYFNLSDNKGAARDSADPDNDGRSNLAEFALGTNPNAADSSGIGSVASLVGFGPTGGNFFFNYTRSKLATADVAYQVEWSDTLASNDWQTTGVSESLVTTNGDTQQVQVTVPRGTANHRFVRLRLTRIY